MNYEDLEPDQDALVRESGARNLFKRNKGPKLEQMYTDHHAGDPDALTPNAERQVPSFSDRGPVRPSLVDRVKSVTQQLPHRKRDI